MTKNKTMWAVSKTENGRPLFHRLNGEPCEVCSLDRCLPSHPHPGGMIYHVEAERFLSWPQIDTLNGKGKPSINNRQEERRRKTKGRVRRHRRKRGPKPPKIAFGESMISTV